MNATKGKEEILRHALYKLQKRTPVTSIGPGSVARSLAEVVIEEIGDLYAAMDHNTSMTLISTASGRSLDLLAELYGVRRKTLADVATAEQSVGAFVFYLDSPHTSDIDIPSGTRVYTDGTNFIGREYAYTVVKPVSIPAGRTRVFAQIRPLFSDSAFTAAKDTVKSHNLTITGVDLRCKNIKEIAPTLGYETDANLRVRIKNEVRRSAGGTADSIRFSGLAVNGVRDIRVKSAEYGLGSVKILVVTEDARQRDVIMPQVEEAIREVAPVGVRTIISTPDYARLAINATIKIKPSFTEVNPQGTAQRAHNMIVRYLNTLLPDDKLVYAQLTQAVLDASEAIGDVAFQTLQVNGVEIPRSNYTPKDGYQIAPGMIEVTPA